MTVKLDPPEQGNSATESSISVAMRTERLRLGYTLTDMAERLRIRASYLQAIEEGRYGELPGATYALGFIRSYAEALGLDPSEVVARFKQETAGGMDTRAQLVFPSPVSEGRIPGGAILFLGLILAGAVYGAWYYMSSRDTSLAEMVPALPESLRVLLGSQAEPAVTGPIAPAAPGNEIVPPVEQDTTDAPAATTETTAATNAEPAVAEPAAAVASAVPVSAPASEPASEPAALEPTAEPAASQASAPPPAVVPTEATPAVTPVAMTVAPAPAAAPMADTPGSPAVEAAVAAPPPAPAAGIGRNELRSYGQDNSGSRVTLKAIGDSWIEVRDGETVLLKRLMRQGDTYRVPNRPGVTLMTGSAGALEIVVDGRTMPTLGAVGAVRRDIALDPEKLTANR